MDWEPFGGVCAPDGWYFKGHMVFYCLGPTTALFSVLLKQGGSADNEDGDTTTEKQAGRKEQRKKQKKKESFEREVGGSGRGMSVEMKVRAAALAQGEDEADMRDIDSLSP